MVRRILTILFVLVVVLGVGAAIAAWITLESWLPTTGKRWLTDEVRKRTSYVLELDSLTYRPLQGFILQGVVLTDPSAPEPVLRASQAAIAVRWLPLLLERHAAFKFQAAVDSPLPVTVSGRGTYDVPSGMLSVNARASTIDLAAVPPPLSGHLPPYLAGGHLDTRIRVNASPGGAPVLAVELIGTDVHFTGPGASTTADLKADMVATPPPSPGEPWHLSGTLSLDDGLFEREPGDALVTGLQATADIEGTAIHRFNASFKALATSWTLEGTAGIEQPVAYELHMSGNPPLEAVASAAGGAMPAGWVPAGPAAIEAVCRGAGVPASPDAVDCLARLRVRGATLRTPHLTDPFTGIAGLIRYDHVARLVQIETLRAAFQGEPLEASGSVRLTSPPVLAVRVNGNVPLEVAREWLTPESPVRDLSGLATVALSLDGPLPLPSARGTIELHNARLVADALGEPLEGMTGTLVLEPNRITIPYLTLRTRGQSWTLNAAVSPIERPTISGALAWTGGELRGTVHVTPRALRIEQAVLTLKETRVAAAGALSLDPAVAHELTLRGVLELAELNALPLVTLPDLEAWQLQGLVTLDGTVRGDPARWQQGRMRGRVTAETIRVRGIPVQQLVCELDQADGTLTARLPGALVADGKLSGQMTMKLSGEAWDYAAQGDLIGMQLAKLQEALPAWRGRKPSGSVSSHASVYGVWQSPSSWRGEGWINAAGEQLADLPILDKFFGGLFGVLAERLGLDLLRRGHVTALSARWMLADQRIRTDDLRVEGLAAAEPVKFFAKGSAGLDGTLDFVVEPELSEQMVLDASATKTLAGSVLQTASQLDRIRRMLGRHRLRGTIRNPDYRFEYSPAELIRNLFAPSSGGLLQNLFESLP